MATYLSGLVGGRGHPGGEPLRVEGERLFPARRRRVGAGDASRRLRRRCVGDALVESRGSAEQVESRELVEGHLGGDTAVGRGKAEEIAVECNIEISEAELVDLTELAYGDKYRGILPSAGGCDEFIRLLVCRRAVKPVVLQNRFYAEQSYDVRLRKFCTEHGVTYQSFWTLTANPDLLAAPALAFT